MIENHTSSGFFFELLNVLLWVKKHFKTLLKTSNPESWFKHSVWDIYTLSSHCVFELKMVMAVVDDIFLFLSVTEQKVSLFHFTTHLSRKPLD